MFSTDCCNSGRPQRHSAMAMAKGQTMVGIAFRHDIIFAAKQNHAVKVVSPCEGTGYEIGSMSIIEGARHPDEAKKFYDWALTPAAQKLATPTTGEWLAALAAPRRAPRRNRAGTIRPHRA